MIFINLALFIMTFVIAVTFRKNEWIVAGLLALVLATLLVYNKFGAKKSAIIIAFGFIMATAEYVCIKLFNMWKYNYVNWVLPVWLPLGWSISGVFLLALLRLI
jgi:hypothetical protein